MAGCPQAPSSPRPAAQESTPQTAPLSPPKSGPASATPVPEGSALSLLDWLDPDAVLVAYGELPADIDVDAWSVVFALPPKLAGLLREVQQLPTILDEIAPPDARARWRHPGALAFESRLYAGTYLLVRRQASEEDVATWLSSAGFHAQEAEGRPLYVPRGAFPWKIALLEPDVVAFIPVRALGVGFQPLSAGRDLPPSELETAIRERSSVEGSTVLQLFAAGPLLHFDLAQDLAQWVTITRRWQRGLDVESQFVPTRDGLTAATELEARDLSLESDQIQRLASRVAYTVEGPTVLGRLQLTPTDVASLRRPR